MRRYSLSNNELDVETAPAAAADDDDDDDDDVNDACGVVSRACFLVLSFRKISYRKYCAHSVPSSISCNLVTEAELITVITKLKKNNKAAGPDNIGPALLKDGIVQPFLHFINLSFSTCVFPDNLTILLGSMNVAREE